MIWSLLPHKPLINFPRILSHLKGRISESWSEILFTGPDFRNTNKAFGNGLMKPGITVTLIRSRKCIDETQVTRRSSVDKVCSDLLEYWYYCFMLPELKFLKVLLAECFVFFCKYVVQTPFILTRCTDWTIVIFFFSFNDKLRTYFNSGVKLFHQIKSCT